MSSRFIIQVVDKVTGKVVEWEPGRLVETEFIEECVSRTISKGVGIGKSEKHVADAIKAGIEETLFNLKSKVRAKQDVG